MNSEAGVCDVQCGRSAFAGTGAGAGGQRDRGMAAVLLVVSVEGVVVGGGGCNNGGGGSRRTGGICVYCRVGYYIRVQKLPLIYLLWGGY